MQTLYGYFATVALMVALHALHTFTFSPSTVASYKVFTSVRLQTGQVPRPWLNSSRIPLPLCALDIYFTPYGYNNLPFDYIAHRLECQV